MYQSLLVTAGVFTAGVFAAVGVAYVRYPDQIYEFRHDNVAADPKLSTAGRRQYEFKGTLFFLLAFVCVLLAFTD